MSNKNTGNSLLLGMVFATEQRAKRGQEYRDRVRCEAMESIGFQVKTLDNKHSDAKLDKHCTANFSDTRRMMKSMDAKWSGEKFDHVILDYFFSPVGWARERWTDPLFTKTFPTLAESGYLAKGCKIWLPNLQCIEDSLSDFAGELAPYFIIRRESKAMENPLYRATEKVEKELLMCPDALTNETQLRPLLNFSNEPFCVLELRSSFLIAPSTPTGKKIAATTASTSVKKRKLHNAVLEETDSSSGEQEATEAEIKSTILPDSKRHKQHARTKSVGRKLQLA